MFYIFSLAFNQALYFIWAEKNPPPARDGSHEIPAVPPLFLQAQSMLEALS